LLKLNTTIEELKPCHRSWKFINISVAISSSRNSPVLAEYLFRITFTKYVLNDIKILISKSCKYHGELNLDKKKIYATF